MFAIGVGKRVDRQELKDIASDPDDDYMFMVDDFNALSSITEMLAAKTCQGMYYCCRSRIMYPSCFPSYSRNGVPQEGSRH